MINCTCHSSVRMVFQGRAWLSASQGALRRRTAPSLPSGHTRRTRHLYKSVTCNPYAESPHKETCTCKNQKHAKVAHFTTPVAIIAASWCKVLGFAPPWLRTWSRNQLFHARRLQRKASDCEFITGLICVCLCGMEGSSAVWDLPTQWLLDTRFKHRYITIHLENLHSRERSLASFSRLWVRGWSFPVWPRLERKSPTPKTPLSLPSLAVFNLEAQKWTNLECRCRSFNCEAWFTKSSFDKMLQSL